MMESVFFCGIGGEVWEQDDVFGRRWLAIRYFKKLWVWDDVLCQMLPCCQVFQEAEEGRLGVGS